MSVTTRRQLLAASAASLSIAALPRLALAQSTKLSRLIVPFPAGGGTDAVARMTADKLHSDFPAGLVVENRAGASGRIGVEYVKDAQPDGSTMLFTTDFVMTIFPYSFRKLNYNPLQDFAPVALCSKTGYALAVGPGMPAEVTNLQQLVAWCKANPSRASFASTSAGAASHFAGLMLSRAIGVDLLHVAYKGGAPALQDLMGGQIPMSINPIGEVLPQMASGKVRVIATTGAQRSRFLPNAPTLVELGLQDMVVESWLGLFMPAKTPADVVTRTAAAFNAALQRKDLHDGYAGIAMETVQGTPASFAAVIKADMERWEPIIKASGFTAEE
ncbi:MULTISPECIES: Bug family tripartite tricarboxylate transporter substrate binding protein [unclassified Variovorax]|uniref:Bug family tripartite tricarboxylate transporter substrate binding protein n=1 Tax=unclassified Variovorax TaxID=663243 RepID=UPI001BD5D6E1|nr:MULTISPECIES: Bug family tripartite tricarboxylate transporter substrate binding protein [unclassified Variovorax]